MIPAATETRACPQCGYANHPDAACCNLCTALLHAGGSEPVAEPSPAAAPAFSGLPRPIVADLALGVVGAALLAGVPMLRFMGWFLGSLVHEMSHCAMAWFTGCPAFPAISLQGHAAAFHQQQVTFLALVIWGGLAGATWAGRHLRTGRWVMGTAVVLYPVLAFTGVREVAFLLAGQLGELVFAAVFFWRFFVGGFSASRAENVAYATLGAYLVGRGLWLDGGLVFSAQTRLWYLNAGSFGLTNDYLRVSHHLGLSLTVIAAGMLFLTLATFPVAWWLARRPRRA